MAFPTFGRRCPWEHWCVLAGHYIQMHTDRRNFALPVLPGGWVPASSRQDAMQSPHRRTEPHQLVLPLSVCTHPQLLEWVTWKPRSVSQRCTYSVLPNPKPNKVQGLFSAMLSQTRPATVNCAAPMHPLITSADLHIPVVLATWTCST